MVFHVSFDGCLGVERLAEDEGEFLLVPKGVACASSAFVCFGRREMGRARWILSAIEHLVEVGAVELAFSGLELDRLLGPTAGSRSGDPCVVVVHTSTLLADMRDVLKARRQRTLAASSPSPRRGAVVAWSVPDPRISFVAVDSVSTTSSLPPRPPKKRVRFLDDGVSASSSSSS